MYDQEIILPLGIEERIQYLSQGKTPQQHLLHIEKVCKSGCKWIQLRLKNENLVTYLETAFKAREICDHYGAILIINDNVSEAKMTQADGVHLGLTDMCPKEARKILGNNYVIGGTANTIEDCNIQYNKGVDYIGLGPHRFTTTKKELKPTLGLEGYKNIVEKLKVQNIKIPVIAIGGITLSDIKKILKTGISGIAVSNLLTNQENLEQTIINIKQEFL